MQADSLVISPQAGTLPGQDLTAEDLHARSGLYGLLGRCLEAEVDHGLLSALRGPLRETLTDLGFDLGTDLMSGAEPEVLARLAEEFAGLFVVPGAVVPFRSAFETGRLFQPQADLACAAYREAGFAFHNVHSGEFADHVAVMLAFVSRLLACQAEAASAGDMDAVALWHQRRVRFMLIQLGPWAIGWSRRAQRCARHPFYQAVLALVGQAIWIDVCELADERTLKRLVAANRRPLVRQKSDPDFRKASGL
jgi:TorA maturation chaperone TorD